MVTPEGELLGGRAPARVRARVAAAIILLHAQPLSRVVRPTLDDIVHDGGQVLLRLDEQQPPDPSAWSQIGNPAARLRAGLADLYRFYRADAGMLATSTPPSAPSSATPDPAPKPAPATLPPPTPPPGAASPGNQQRPAWLIVDFALKATASPARGRAPGPGSAWRRKW